MSYKYENNINLIENNFSLLIEQLIKLNEKIELLEGKIDNININFKKNNYIEVNNKWDYVDWECVHLY
jgi:hypothetical protein|uniref:Uncharacterized protein n=1 Tax=viral metagenome TaxID=1070528 RepID=A0A6C0HWJ0_9ZZZZ